MLIDGRPLGKGTREGANVEMSGTRGENLTGQLIHSSCNVGKGIMLKINMFFV